MVNVKYYQRIKALRSIDLKGAGEELDMSTLQPKGWRAKLLSWVMRKPHGILRLLRAVAPVFRIGRLVVVTDSDAVEEVLTNTKTFAQPYGREMCLVSGGDNFVLGMNEGKLYRKQKSLILRAFAPEEMHAEISRQTRRQCAKTLRRIDSEFDAIGGVMVPVAVALCENYFGLKIGDKQRFYHASLAVNSFLFADLGGDQNVRALAMNGASCLLKTINLSIKSIECQPNPEHTPLQRLVAEHQRDPQSISLKEIQAIMVGMITGFLPTTILGVGRAFEYIVTHRQAYEMISDAVGKKKDDLVASIIKEAMRFRPIWVGPFRYTTSDYVFSEGRLKGKKIAVNSLVIPSTLATMFDPAIYLRPYKFDPNRDQSNTKIFGFGMHYCIGAPMAMAFAIEYMKAIFSLPQIEPVRSYRGRLERMGIYPNKRLFRWKPHVKYGNQTLQSMITVYMPIKNRQYLGALSSALKAFGNVADASIDSPVKALSASKKIHFMSACITPQSHLGRSFDASYLLLELSADEDDQAALKLVADVFAPPLEALIRKACEYPEKKEFAQILVDAQIKNVGPLGKNTGLLFNGTPGHSVQRIHEEANLSSELSQILNVTFEQTFETSLARFKYVRDTLSKKDEYNWAFSPARNRLNESALGIKVFFMAAIKKPFVLAFAVIAAATLLSINMSVLGGLQEGLWGNIWRIGLASVVGILEFGFVLFVLLIALLYRLRKLEEQDQPSDQLPEQSDYDAITANENQLQQNHMYAISVVKPGLTRLLLLRLVLWWISIAAQFKNPAGTLSHLDTIHFARWVKIPGSRQLVFMSNYSGSWESYLEDFITKTSTGLTGVWSNTIGFPKTRFLLYKGAKASEKFKHWARRQQLPTPFWYVGYPDITTAQIRKNALMRQGLSDVDDENEAAAWLSLFGSKPRTEETLNKSNIQALVFGSMAKRLPEATLYAIQFSPHNASSLLREVERKISFGDQLNEKMVMQFAVSSSGMECLGLHENVIGDAGFSNAFCQGMTSTARQRLLGDDCDSAPVNWAWGSESTKVDAVVLIFAADINAHRAAEIDFQLCVSKARAKIIHQQELSVEKNKQNKFIEHFGFVDGISQPIIRGTRRAYNNANAADVVNPGEFICGYPDGRDNRARCIKVRADSDINSLLPLALDGTGSKDFGQNGSYLVIRQLQQDVHGFQSYCQQQASEIRSKFGIRDVDDEWVAAKMIGRWRNGQPLVRHPQPSENALASNDFGYAEEDDRGFACPIGAHIRRSNPRDSLGADPKQQRQLANRHRILRLGRTYVSADATTKGVMFMCLNADIERQFEFVQQTWMNNPHFGKLLGESDPFVSAQQSTNSCFTIPHHRGNVVLKTLPRFITTRGGGYFFLPGRQALSYLASL